MTLFPASSRSYSSKSNSDLYNSYFYAFIFHTVIVLDNLLDQQIGQNRDRQR